MKKLSASFILLLMIISSFSFSAFAKGVTEISVANVVAEKQSEVSVPIKISNNQGLWGMVFNVYFDTDALKLKEVVNNGDVFNSGALLIGPSDLSKGYVRVVITPSNVSSNNTANGTICTLKLNVSKDAELKKYSFKIDLEDVLDVEGEDVEVTGTDGSVTVQKTVESTVQTNTQKQTDSKQTSSKEEKTEEVVARAENNKLVEVENSDKTDSAESVSGEEEKNDNSKATQQTEQVGESVTEEKQGITDSSSQVTAKSKSSSINYIITAAVVVLIIAAVTVLIVALLKRRKNK
ncbi:MAG: hypothetical protein U0L17_04170 [Acutalibacteraceae bacterium]|nr:hypothetical protein [Acutalibacteraceae bacterium]